MLMKIFIFKREMELKMDCKTSLYKVSDYEVITNKHQLVHSSRNAMFHKIQCGRLSVKIFTTQTSQSKNNHLQHIELAEVSMH